MNSKKVEAIYRRVWPQYSSGYDYPRRTAFIDWIQNGLAILWGCRKAEDLAAAGNAKWAHAFWVWAVDCYHWRAEGAPTREEYERFLDGDKRIEVRLIRAAHCMGTLGVNSAWELPCEWSVALSRDELNLIVDAMNRGLEPQTVLWPKPRRNRKYIALMAAAQTIAEHEPAKS